jgi:DNA-binding response OmpR family regulator
LTLRILLVEKDLTTADLLVPSLERKGYQVVVAHSQRSATSRIRSGRPDVLVMDVASFGASGYRISDMLRSRLQGVATILLLAEGHSSAGSSAEAFMTPPFTSRKLLYRIRKVAESLPERMIQVGDLALDPETRMLRRGSAVTQLRPKEATLLMHFMRHPGRVLPRREIMKAVWETDYVGDTATLNVHVRWLRTKIEDDPSAPRYLRTVRGVGYRFDVPQATGQG